LKINVEITIIFYLNQQLGVLLKITGSIFNEKNRQYNNIGGLI